LSPFTFLCPLKPRLSPPFFAAVGVQPLEQTVGGEVLGGRRRSVRN
jgi:hypothetical protein